MRLAVFVVYTVVVVADIAVAADAVAVVEAADAASAAGMAGKWVSVEIGAPEIVEQPPVANHLPQCAPGSCAMHYHACPLC